MSGFMSGCVVRIASKEKLEKMPFFAILECYEQDVTRLPEYRRKVMEIYLMQHGLALSESEYPKERSG